MRLSSYDAHTEEPTGRNASRALGLGDAAASGRRSMHEGPSVASTGSRKYVRCGLEECHNRGELWGRWRSSPSRSARLRSVSCAAGWSVLASRNREVIRAKLVLLAAAGLSDTEIAARLDCTDRIVAKWRRRFRVEGLAGLDERPRARAAAVVFPPADRRGQGAGVRASGPMPPARRGRDRPQSPSDALTANRGRAAGVDGLDDLGVVDALEPGASGCLEQGLSGFRVFVVPNVPILSSGASVSSPSTNVPTWSCGRVSAPSANEPTCSFLGSVSVPSAKSGPLEWRLCLFI
jgi:hypothetical protein